MGECRALLTAEEVRARQQCGDLIPRRALTDQRDADARQVGDLGEAVQFLLRRETPDVPDNHLAVRREA